MKKIKYFLYFLLFVLMIVIFDMIKINHKYENKTLVEISSKNINSTFILKIFNFIDSKYENFLLSAFKNNKKYWSTENINERNSLPDVKVIKSGIVFTENKHEYLKNKEDWPRSHGNNNSNRFSDLDLINKNNLNKLDIAWIYNSNDRHESHWDFDIQCNPIIINGKIFTPTAGGYIVSVDGFSGKEIWRSKKFKDDVARRGIVYWPGDKFHEPRIFFSDHNYLVALNIKNGELIKSFGKNGYVKTGPSKVAPIIFKNNLVTTTFDKNVEIYDLTSGKLISKIFFGDEKNQRNGGKKYDAHNGTNPWGGFSADLERGIAYVTTGNPGNYFDGTKRPGKNNYSNSVIAVDLNKKKYYGLFKRPPMTYGIQTYPLQLY